ncbi:quercetin 2,3-dioxygenase [Streptomyces sp. NBC_00080]|uniref:quercetin 2,3-dioxygenase n=1 Tax=Streptomyces TaxID=1883 RepID=UPI00114EA745|nr:MULTISPECIES: quercetin 2,3-dioxygenase [Streptomyces]TQJ56560.1 cupin domain [Streptomyces sp. SLBN-115]
MTAEFAQSGGAKRLALPGKPVPFFLEAGEGERSHLFDALITVLLSKDETGGRFGLFTYAAPKGDAIPTHSHADVHETFYLLSGRARVWIQDGDGETHEKLLKPGDFGYVPAGCLHTFRVEADDTKIMGASSGGFERFFGEAGTRTDSPELPNPPYIPSHEQLARVAREHRQEFRFDLRPLDG